jgi:mono/diheme cytochrome c family protein
MNKLFVAMLLLPLAQGAASAQTAAGDPAAGKTYWERDAPRATACRNCHGLQGQGAFGPDLAGRGLNAAQVKQAVRKPWGIMPAFVESQMSDQEAADIAAYFATLPKVAEPGKWRFEPAAGAPPGQAALINIGCGQCHGVNLDGPRGNLGAVNADFDYFANLVYNHTTALGQHRALLGNNATNIDMGNYSRTRLSEGMLRQIYFWARDEIGFRVPLQAQLGKGETGPSGVTYPLTVTNGGLAGKGVIAEGLTVTLQIPADAQVVAATGTGYQGVHADDKAKANLAVWKLPRSAPKDQEKLSITLSKAGTATDNLRGNIRWSKPAPKEGPSPDVVNIAPAPL